MNYHDSPDEATFRQVVRDFIAAEAPRGSGLGRGEGVFGGGGETWKQ